MVGEVEMKASFFITYYDKKINDFGVGVIKEGKSINIGTFKTGIQKEEIVALLKIMKQHSVKENNDLLFISPGICVELQFSELVDEKIKNPIFIRFLFETHWQECRYEKLLGIDIAITHPEKLLFPNSSTTKLDYINYLQTISPFLLPFLKNRLLTTIRFPHGLFGESFYQKQCPDYAPDFVDTYLHEDINYVVCNNLSTLLWLGNQLAFEFHIPFETIHSDGMPSEIVFDLDPPSIEMFYLAIQAAKMIKDILDRLHLISFIKISGNKGIQIYIPLPEKQFTYEEVRLFTEFVATFMVNSEPNLFTIERLKKNRKNRLYIDYIQHSEGKTIVAPYSIRGKSGGCVACPIEWEELTDNLTPKVFTMENVITRIQKANPFKNFTLAKNEQPFQQVLNGLKSNL